jgi:nucleoside-diphosphate-sugar epimerase
MKANSIDGTTRRMSTKVLVTGAGGFIGHHLVKLLKNNGYWVRGVDINEPEFEVSAADEFAVLDLRNWQNCLEVTKNIDEVYALAADMGGMGFITNNHAQIIHNNSLINLHTIEAARINGTRRIFYSSSACVYPAFRQTEAEVAPLKEEDVLPAEPEDAYGWEKLATEKLYEYYRSDYGLETRVARFHNIFGPLGTWTGGREKAPAAMCRKVAVAKHTGNPEIEIWGDGEQTRSFCHVNDCVDGIYRLMRSDHSEPLNLGQDRMVSINELAQIIANIANTEIKIRHIEGPQGVRGRNSDNTRLEKVLGWSPQLSLEEGLADTYAWIEAQVLASLEGQTGASELSQSYLPPAKAGGYP